MDWTRYDLFLGAIRVGLIIQTEGFTPYGWGYIVLDPTVADPKKAEFMRIARFIDLIRESARLSNLIDEDGPTTKHQSIDSELEVVGPAFLDSENWCLVNILGHREPIPCPEFQDDDVIAWRWDLVAE